ncbi:MAG: glycosyltransferase family 4 protein [Paludibacteraceae bacterium]|nr:glycosyltransferase family 4 protein [Paludibacteraceae bacterium]
MSKTLYINGLFLAQKQTGVQVVAYEMCQALHKLGWHVVCLMPDVEIEDSYSPNFEVVKLAGHTGHIWEQTTLRRYLKKIGSPLFINLFGLGVVGYKNQVVSVHDIAYSINPKWFGWSYRTVYGLLLPILTRQARKVLTVSEFSKREIIKEYSISSDKIVIVSPAPKNRPHSEVEPGVEGKYVIAVSSIDPRKNFEMLIKAFVRRPDDGVKLVVVGGANKVFGDTIIDNTDNRIEFLGRVSDERLDALYRNATLYVCSSLYEGFGIPALEAMQHGCPVAVSDIEVFHEVLGDNAVYFDPTNPDDIAEKITDALSKNYDENDRNALVEYSKRYNMDYSAEKLTKELEKLL